MNRSLFVVVMIFVVCGTAFVVSGCATTQEPRIVTREVKVPVVLPCVGPDVPGAPEYPDTDDALKAAPNAAARYTLMGAGREKRRARLNLLERVVDICRIPAKQIDGGGRGATAPG